MEKLKLTSIIVICLCGLFLCGLLYAEERDSYIRARESSTPGRPEGALEAEGARIPEGALETERERIREYEKIGIISGGISEAEFLKDKEAPFERREAEYSLDLIEAAQGVY